MKEQGIEIDNYFLVKKNIFWMGAIVIIATIGFLCYRIYYDAQLSKESEYKESYKTKFGVIDSKLENNEECYLCGNADRSLMGYYRKFDTIGIIGLNEWYILDLRLKSFDEQGNENDSGSMGMSFGTTQGVCYQVNSVASRGMSNIKVSSEEVFNAECIQNNLCQECLDKVTATLERYCKEGERETFNPFVLVDFQTLEIYSLQGNYTAMSVRNYWLEVELANEETIVNAYYLPDRS